MKNKYLLSTAYERAYYWFYLLLLLAATPVFAQPTLVRDINVGAGSSNPTAIVQLNGALCFIARDGNGSWLWRSNGTTAGTVKLAPVQVESYTQVNGILFFKANSATSGTELWKSDGSVAGTMVLKDINPGAGSSTPAIVTVLNGIVYFNAYNGSSTGLWRTDGTVAGTLQLSAASAANFTSVNGTTYFSGTNAAFGTELWKSDGTAAGTVMLKDINPGAGSSAPTILTTINGLIYLLADNGTNGKELWCTNGTAAGTLMLKDINPGMGHSNPTSLTNINGKLFFIAHNGVTTTLWRSDGTPAGTIRLSNAGVTSFTNINGMVYFVGTEAVHGSELWKTDGTQTGTLLLKDINPGTGGSAVTSLQSVNTTVYFQADDGTHGAELWKTDGTSLGTRLLKDIQPGPGSSSPVDMESAGGRLIFRVVLPSKDYPYLYQQFWSSNGSESGTGPVSDRWDAQYLSNPTVYNLSHGLFAVRETYGGYEDQYRGYDVLAYSIQEDTMRVQLQSGYSYLSEYINTALAEGVLHVIATEGGSYSITYYHWRSDGSGEDFLYEGSRRSSLGIVAIEKGNLYYTIEDTYLDPYSDPYEIHAVGPNPSEWPDSFTALVHNGIKYSVKQDKLGTELWRTAPTARVRDLTPGSAESTISNLVGLNNAIYFTFDNGTNGTELWKYDPSACIAPANSFEIIGGTVCDGSDATVKVTNTQPGILYQLYLGNEPVGPAQAGGTNLSFTIPAARINYYYQMTVIASGCYETEKVKYLNVVYESPVPYPKDAIISSGQRATLTATDDPDGEEYRWYSAETGGTLLHTGVNYTTPVLNASTAYYVATYLPGCGESARAKVAVSVSTQNLFRVNAGGVSYSSGDNRVFSADGYYTWGAEVVPVTGDIGGTADDKLYQTGREGYTFSYDFPAINGSYDVVLHFAETYWGVAANGGGAGSRKFNVDVEGSRKLTDYDIFTRAGGAMRIAQETFRVQVSDGQLTVTFSNGSAGMPVVSAIEIVPAGSFYRINAGGDSYTTLGGNSFARDIYYNGGTISATTGDITNTGDDYLYLSRREGVFGYGLPTGNGTFDVTLHFAETYFGKQVAGGVGSRKFDILLENVKILSNYDVFAKAGGAMKATKETIRVTVKDGILNLYLNRPAGTSFTPMLSAVELAPAPANGAPVLAAIGNKTVSKGSTLTFTATATDLAVPLQTLTYSLVNAPAGASINAATGQFSWTPTQAAGQYSFSVKVTDNGVPALSDEELITVTVTNPLASNQYRINTGGGAFTTGDSKVFAADAYFTGGTIASITAGDVLNTTNDELYRNNRTGDAFSYNLPLASGTYDVVLHFNETYWGYRTTGGAGSRRFHVDVEGSRKLTDYDIFVKAGGAMRARTETIRVSLTDGTLNILFSKGLADKPCLAALEVIPVPVTTTRRINTGGSAFTASGGRTFAADAYFTGGAVSAITTGDVVNTTDDELYRNNRYGTSFSYNLPLSSGTYDVTLHFCETYYGYRTTGGVGSRKFNVDIEGARRLTEYDIYAKATGAMRAKTETFRITLSDGTLNVIFSKGSTDNPAVAAIEVVPAPQLARVADAGSSSRESSTTGSLLYPNPVKDKLFVVVELPTSQVTSTVISDASGVNRVVNAHKVVGENTLEIDVSALKTGIYLLQLGSSEGYQLLKFIKQ